MLPAGSVAMPWGLLNLVLSELSVGAEKHRSSIAEETAHVLPALPVYVRIQEKTLNLARLPDFLLW